MITEMKFMMLSKLKQEIASDKTSRFRLKRDVNVNNDPTYVSTWLPQGDSI